MPPSRSSGRCLLSLLLAAAAGSGFLARPAEADQRPFAGIVDAAARRHGVDADLVHAVIAVESGYRATAQSPAGAQGLMQLMPGTQRDFGVVDAFDPRQNVDAGVAYLRRLTDEFGTVVALAAYNAGPGAARRYNGIPPYEETRAYLQAVLARNRPAAGEQAAEDHDDTADRLHAGSEAAPADDASADLRLHATGMNPGLPRSPDEIRTASGTFETTACRVRTAGSRLEITFDGLSMGIFSGELRFTVYEGTNLVRLDAENGYWFYAHPRTKGSTGYPDAELDTPWIGSDRYLVVAFKPGMGADLSARHLCDYRGFGSIDTLNNHLAGSGLRPKYLIADSDTYHKFPGDDIYPNVPVNYLRLDRVPGPDEDWTRGDSGAGDSKPTERQADSRRPGNERRNTLLPASKAAER